jgi:hypothetical protein
VLSRGLDIAMAQQKFQVHVAPHRRIAVSQQGNHRALHEHRVDVSSRKILKDAKKLCCHAQGEEMLESDSGLQIFARGGRNCCKPYSLKPFCD